MISQPRSALALFKASLELRFRLCDLTRRNTLRWNEAHSRMIDSCAGKLLAPLSPTPLLSGGKG